MKLPHRELLDFGVLGSGTVLQSCEEMRRHYLRSTPKGTVEIALGPVCWNHTILIGAGEDDRTFEWDSEREWNVLWPLEAELPTFHTSISLGVLGSAYLQAAYSGLIGPGGTQIRHRLHFLSCP